MLFVTMQHRDTNTQPQQDSGRYTDSLGKPTKHLSLKLLALDLQILKNIHQPSTFDEETSGTFNWFSRILCCPSSTSSRVCFYFFLTRGESTALPRKRTTERAFRDHSGSRVALLNFPSSCSLAKLRRQNSS